MKHSIYGLLVILMLVCGMGLQAMQGVADFKIRGGVEGSYFDSINDLLKEEDLEEAKHIINAELRRDEKDQEENDKLVQFFTGALKRLAVEQNSSLAMEKLRLLVELYGAQLSRFDEEALKTFLAASREAIKAQRLIGEAGSRMVAKLEEALRIKQSQNTKQAVERAAKNADQIVQLAASEQSLEKTLNKGNQTVQFSLISDRIKSVRQLESRNAGHLIKGEGWEDEDLEVVPVNPQKIQAEADCKSSGVSPAGLSMKERVELLSHQLHFKSQPQDNRVDYQTIDDSDETSESSSDEESADVVNDDANKLEDKVADSNGFASVEEMILAAIAGAKLPSKSPSLESSIVKNERMTAEAEALLKAEEERVQKELLKERLVYEASKASQQSDAQVREQPSNVSLLSERAPNFACEDELDKLNPAVKELLLAAVNGEILPEFHSLESSIVKNERMTAEAEALLKAEEERVQNELLKERLEYEARIAAERVREAQEAEALEQQKETLRVKLAWEKTARDQRELLLANMKAATIGGQLCGTNGTAENDREEGQTRNVQESEGIADQAPQQGLQRLESERLVAEQARQQVERQRLEAEKLAAEQARQQVGRQRLETEGLAEQARQRVELQRIEAERLAAEQARQQIELQRIEAERLAAEQARQQVERQRIEAERLAAEQARQQVERQRIEAERLAAEQARQQVERQRLETERLAEQVRQRVELQRLEAERLAAEQARQQEKERRLAATDVHKKNKSLITIRNGLVVSAIGFLAYQLYKYSKDHKNSQDRLHFRTPQISEAALEIY